MIFKDVQIIFPDCVEAGCDVLVENGVIAGISSRDGKDTRGTKDEREWSAHEVVALDGCYLAPGFIDLHIHGAMGRDTMEATPAAFEAICNYHATGGTTSLLLTTVTAPTEEIVRVLRAVEEMDGIVFEHGAQILGAHVEGPYVSKEKPGAQTARFIRNPQPDETAAILKHGRVIRRMTLAPELPGALELIDALCAHHIRVSGGHSDAWDEEARTAFERGMRQVTHTFNCMSSARRRGLYRVAGLLEFAMSEPGVLCELIADDRHVSGTLMRMLYRAKGAEGICLVTDATAGAGLDEGAEFRLSEVDCVVRDAVGVTADGKALAGSTAEMIRLVRNMVNIAGAPLHEAVKMATLNPARALGIETRKGCISEGADADLVVLSRELDVMQTYVGGRCVFS